MRQFLEHEPALAEAYAAAGGQSLLLVVEPGPDGTVRGAADLIDHDERRGADAVVALVVACYSRTLPPEAAELIDGGPPPRWRIRGEVLFRAVAACEPRREWA